MAIRKKPAKHPSKGLTPRKRDDARVELERRGIVVRSEGQRLLLAVDATQGEIQNACGVSHQSVIDWRFGRKTPSPAARASLWNAYEIPAHAWGRLPEGMQPASSAAPEAKPSNGHAATSGNGHAPPPSTTSQFDAASAPSSLSETAALIARIRDQLQAPDLLPSDRVRITDSYTRTIALQHRLQREADLLEDRIVREHPTWIRIKAELARVLTRHPQVAVEVCDALDRLGM